MPGMADQTHLLEDPSTAQAIATHIGVRRGHRIVGLHDGVMVRDRNVGTEPILDQDGYWAGSRATATITAPYETVEVVLATPTNRVYAERHRGTLDELLLAAGVTSKQQAS